MVDRTRLDFVDNLRWVVVLTVVGMHAAVTYSHLGSWYYMAPETPGPEARQFFLLFQVQLQAFFMGFMFLLAGYFVPASYDRKGFRRFVTDRCIRLGVPTLLYMFVIHPLMGYFLLGWWPLDLPAAYWRFLVSGRWLSATGPMWFAVALLFFSLIYALIRAAVPARRPAGPVPPVRAVLATGLIIAALAFVFRIGQPIGTNVYNMQLGYFAQYIVLFAAGTLAARRDWLRTVLISLGYRLLVVAVAGGTPVLFALAALVRRAGLPLDQVNGLGTWPSAAFALWESMFCVAMCTGLVVLFREKLNRKGRALTLLGDNSFGVYWLHPPVLIGLSLALAPLAWPPVAKFALLWVLAFAATFLFVQFVARRVPYLNRLL